MDHMDGFAFYDHLNRFESFRTIPFIFLSAKTKKEDKMRGLSRGAIHYINKPFDIDILNSEIESILELLNKIIQENRQRLKKEAMADIITLQANESSYNTSFFKNFPIADLISSREKEVAFFILKGYQNKEIADIMDISPRTVDKHIENIYKKFNVQNRVELIMKFNLL